MTDAWHWRAVYRDGEVLDEYLPDGSGKTAGFAAVDRGRLAVLLLVPQRPGLATIHVPVPEDDPTFEPIFFRQRTKRVDPVTMREVGQGSITVLGWRRGDAEGYAALYTDGSIMLTHDRAAFDGSMPLIEPVTERDGT